MCSLVLLCLRVLCRNCRAIYLAEGCELELIFVPQGYPFDQLLLLLYAVAVEELQHICQVIWYCY